MSKEQRRINRVRRVRTKLKSVGSGLRLHIHRGLRFMSVQIIDDQKGVTLIGVHQKQYKAATVAEQRTLMAKDLAKKITASKLTKLYVDRGWRAYHGIIKSFVEQLREQGIKI